MMGRWGDGEMGRRVEMMGRWGDGEMGRWGDKGTRRITNYQLPIINLQKLFYLSFDFW